MCVYGHVIKELSPFRCVKLSMCVCLCVQVREREVCVCGRGRDRRGEKFLEVKRDFHRV